MLEKIVSDVSVPSEEEPNVVGSESIKLSPLPASPEGRSLEHKQENNSMIVTVIYIGGILFLLGGSVALATMIPFWILGQLKGTVPEAQLSILVELIKGSSTLLSNLVSGLLTALGIGIGYFFRRNSTAKD